MPELDPQLKADLEDLGQRKQSCAEKYRSLREYGRGSGPLPDAIVRANVTKAYRLLMPMSDAPWASVITEAVQDRLEVTGIQTGNDMMDDVLWDDWRRNNMDSESSLAHNATLTAGRSYATVWPGMDGKPEIILDSPENMVVKYAPGSRRKRIAALRHWVEGETPYATLYYPNAIYKFRGPENSSWGGRFSWGRTFWGTEATMSESDTSWEPYQPPEDRTWPVNNPFGTVPVVEIATNRELEPGSYPFARGEFENCVGVIDRINLLTFLGLVVAFWMGFPLRGVIGEKILYDDDGAAIKPFDVNADSMFQLENPEARLAEFDAADRGNLSITAELEQLATVSNTPRHYFPMSSGTSNISAETVVAWESGLHGKIANRHKPQIGTSWEEVFRLVALMGYGEQIPNIASVTWAEHESRSLAERADAAVKLKEILPWQALAEKVLNANAEQIARWEAQRGSDMLSSLIAQPESPEMAVAEPTDTQPA